MITERDIVADLNGLLNEYELILKKKYYISDDKDSKIIQINRSIINLIEDNILKDFYYIKNFFLLFIKKLMGDKKEYFNDFIGHILHYRNLDNVSKKMHDLFCDKEIIDIVFKNHKDFIDINEKDDCFTDWARLYNICCLFNYYIRYNKSDYAEYFLSKLNSSTIPVFLKHTFSVGKIVNLSTVSQSYLVLKNAVDSINDDNIKKSQLKLELNKLIRKKSTYEEIMALLENTDISSDYVMTIIKEISDNHLDRIKETIEFILYLNPDYKDNIYKSKAIFNFILSLFRSIYLRKNRYIELKKNTNFYCKLFSELNILEKDRNSEEEDINGYFLYHVLNVVLYENDHELMSKLLESLSKNMYLMSFEKTFNIIYTGALSNLVHKPSHDMKLLFVQWEKRFSGEL